MLIFSTLKTLAYPNEWVYSENSIQVSEFFTFKTDSTSLPIKKTFVNDLNFYHKNRITFLTSNLCGIMAYSRWHQVVNQNL